MSYWVCGVVTVVELSSLRISLSITSEHRVQSLTLPTLTFTLYSHFYPYYLLPAFFLAFTFLPHFHPIFFLIFTFLLIFTLLSDLYPPFSFSLTLLFNFQHPFSFHILYNFFISFSFLPSFFHSS